MEKIVDDFICLYRATLLSVDISPKEDKFLSQLLEESHSKLTQYHMIRDQAETESESYPSFALSYAIEYRNKTTDEIKKLAEEIERILGRLPNM